MLKKNIQFHLNNLTALCSLIFLTSCNTSIPHISFEPSSQPKHLFPPLANGFSPDQIRKRQAELAVIAKKVPYLGPISLKIDTGLIQLEPGSGGKSIDLSQLIEMKKNSFSTQSLPEGLLTFQEVFEAPGQAFETLRTFKVSDISKRYTLHIQNNSSNNAHGKVSVNINGNDLIQQKHLNQGTLEIQQESLLLNSTNSIRISIDSETNLSLTVSILETGQAGTILKRRGQLGQPKENHQSHITQNDINVYNPYDLTSLGGLSPYEGIEKYESNSGKAYEFSSLSLNNVPVKIENDRLVMVFKDEGKKQSFLQAYNAQIESEEYGISIVKFDLSRAPIHNLGPLIRHANTLMFDNIHSVSASSSAGLKIFAILLDILKNHQDSYYYVEPSFKLTLDQASPIVPPNTSIDWNDGHQSWWLKTTKVLDAWSYSIGTGIRVGWIDLGSDFLNRNHPELLRQTDKNFSANHNLPYVTLAGNAAAPFDSHSLMAQFVGFAERGNKEPTVGVAPNATVIPYNVLTHSEKTVASMIAAEKAKVHVIGSSYGCLNCRDPIFRFFENTAGGGDTLSATINHITSYMGIPYVNSSGNGGDRIFNTPHHGIHVKDTIPSAEKAPNAIFVGAIVPPDKNSVLGGANTRYAPTSDYQVTFYSNYGENVIYAPGEGIWVSDPLSKLNSSTPPKMSYMNGTSAAAPFITGVVALMLSRNPNLTVPQIMEILKDSSKITSQPPINDPNVTHLLSPRPPSPQTYQRPAYANTPGALHLIDVEHAVKQAIAAGPYSAKTPTEYIGIVNNPGRKRLILNKFSENGASDLEKHRFIDIQTINDESWSKVKDGAFIKIKAWSDINVGKVHNFTLPTLSFLNPVSSNIYNILPIKISNMELEILDVEHLCDLKNGSTTLQACTSTPAGMFPTVSKFQITQNGASNLQTFHRNKDIEVEVQGSNLWLNNYNFSGAKGKLVLHEVDSATGAEVAPANRAEFDIAPSATTNNASSLKFKIPSSELMTKIKMPTTPPTGGVTYKFSLSLLTGKTSLISFSGGSVSSNSFNILSSGPGNNCEQWSVRAYNVDDTATAYLNQNPRPVLNYSYQGETGFINITNQLHPGTNHLAFKIHNENRGYAWGFEVKKNTDIVYHIEAGQAGIFGANNNDQSKPNQNIPFNGNSFTFSANPCPFTGGGFSISNISDTVPPNPPPQIKVWLTRNSQQVEVNSSNFVGIGIDTEDIASIDVEIDGQSMPIGYLAEKYLAFGIPADMSPGVKDVIIKLAGGSQVTLAQAIKVLARPPLELVQGLSAQGAISVKSFNLQNTPHLAVANSGGEAKIYRWNGGQFNQIQSLGAETGYDFEEFQHGNDQYLILSNYAGGYGWYTVVYKWNGSQFVDIQYLHTAGGTDAEVFRMGDETYLAVASNGYYRWPGPEPSRIYKWNGSLFVEIQQVITEGAFKWEHFKIGNDDYLGYVQYRYSGPKDTQSPIFKWNGSQFELFQYLPGSYPQDMETFSIGNDHFLALSNYGNQVNTTDPNANQMNSVIYKWNGSGFVPFQNIPTQGGKRWKYFSSGGRHYLMNANDYNSARLYRWTGSTFELYRTFLGASVEWDWVNLEPGKQLLVGARYNEPIEVYDFE